MRLYLQKFRVKGQPTKRIIGSLIALSVLLLGCSASYCQLKNDPDLAAIFAAGKPLPGYTYYSAGRDRMPNAIIGVRDGYELTSKFWTKIDVESGGLEKVSRSMFPYRNNTLRGYYALAPDGTKVVIWYSAYNFGPTVKMGEGNTIEVFQPPPDEDRSS